MVKDLAARIKEAQGPEITTMKGWLAEWGEEPLEAGDGAHAGMDMSDAGMMSDEEMASLEMGSGKDFDRLFLEMMIRHHEGALAMATTETDNGTFAPARRLATQITTSQQAEIDEMEGMLSRTSG